VIAADDLGAWYGFGTIEIGFDFQFADSPLVIGILGSYDFNGNTDDETNGQLAILPVLDPDLADLNSHLKVETDDAWFLGGRVGFSVFNNASLLYVLGGYTWINGSVESEHSLDVLGAEVASFTIEEDETVDGWTLGGGVETLLWENVSLKVEYRHDFLDEIEFEDRTVLDEDDDGDQLVLDHDGSVDFGRDTIRAVLSWRMNPFDW
jgi:outer membrane immunogenic protein